jgi:hypothetical protein
MMLVDTMICFTNRARTKEQKVRQVSECAFAAIFYSCHKISVHRSACTPRIHGISGKKSSAVGSFVLLKSFTTQPVRLLTPG